MWFSQILVVTSRNDKVKMFPRVFVIVVIFANFALKTGHVYFAVYVL